MKRVTDVLGEPYLAETLPLPPDDEGDVVATLVRRTAAGPDHQGSAAPARLRRLLLPDRVCRLVDRARLRLLRARPAQVRPLAAPHQTPNYVTDLRDYYPEIDAAWQRVIERDGHTDVVLSAHSTGGLVVGLWADDRRPAQLVGAVMNSPWLDLQGSALLRVVGTPILKQVGSRQPRREIKRHVTGFYTRSLHRDHEGEWDFNLVWKPIESFTVYAGWLRAVREGHARMHRGLELSCPVLVLSSGRSTLPEEMGEEVHGTDIVLDVSQIRRWATAYGPHVTYVAVEGARHDVVLSREEPRRAAYDAIATWMTAWVDPPKRELL